MSQVVVVGGSAAGLFAADLLARGGARVRVFDATGPAPLPRTLIVTSRLSDALGFMPSAAVVNRLTSVRVMSPKRAATITLQEPDLVVERATILRILAERALQAGAEICSGYRLIGMTPSADGARLVLQDLKRDSTEEVVATTVVGADGSFSTVAKFAERRVRETVPIVQALVPLPPGASPQQTQVWFDPAVTPYFLWSFPESAQRAAVGLIARDGRTARGALERFLRTLGLTPIAWQAARVPLFRRAPRPWTRLGGCDVFLVGDAAGHVKVSTVGGLVTGLRGARAVAEAILTQAPYQACLRALDRELTLHRWVRLVLNRFRPKDYDDLLDLLEGPPAALLGAYTRDELAATFVRLLRAQPRLAKFARRLVFA